MRCRRRSLAVQMVALIVLGAGLVLVALLSLSYAMQRRAIFSNAAHEGVTIAQSLAYQIESELSRAESLVEQTAIFLKDLDLDRASGTDLIRKTLEAHPSLFGMAVALSPDVAPNSDFDILYGWRDADRVRVQDRKDPTLDYQHDWFYLPYYLQKPVWTDPYYDMDAETLMVTYSVPVLHGDAVRAVVTCDISLQGMRDLLEGLPLGENGAAVLMSQRGAFIVHPEESYEMRETVFSLAESATDPEEAENLYALGRDMLSGVPGYRLFWRPLTGEPSCIFYHTVPSTGWPLGVLKPEKDVLAGIVRLNRMMMLVGAAGLALLLIPALAIAWSISRPLRRLAGVSQRLATGDFDTPVPAIESCNEVSLLAKAFEQMRCELRRYVADLTATTAAKERIAGELSAAREIQMSIVPKLFPPFPERSDIDLYAVLIPALEVGGDLYDFALLDEDHLYVAIGDVSGKGVPASLLMAVGKTLLKSTIQTVRTPARAMSHVNDELAEGNEACMFITMFCGILNLKTGVFIYANAGHNPPLLRHADGAIDCLQDAPNPPLGVCPGHPYRDNSLRMSAGDLLVLYTDGVSEAMSPDHVMFEMDGLEAYIRAEGGRGARAFVEGLGQAVHAHADGAEQSDDITALALRYRVVADADCAAASVQTADREPDAVITLDNRLDELARLNAWLQDQGRARSVAPEQLAKIGLAFEEWFVNVVSYAYADDAAHRVEVRMWAEDGALRFAFIDDGAPFDPTAQAAADTSLPLEHRQVGGLGIHFIRTTMDQFAYRRDGERNIVTMVKEIDG